MKAKEVMKKYDICRSTLWRWIKLGRISYEKLPSGRYIYQEPLSKYHEEEQRKNIVYCRVSPTTQKDNLPRQIERVSGFASSKGHVIDDVYSEVASALNYNRKKYRKLYKEVRCIKLFKTSKYKDTN